MFHRNYLHLSFCLSDFLWDGIFVVEKFRYDLESILLTYSIHVVEVGFHRGVIGFLMVKDFGSVKPRKWDSHLIAS